MSWPVRHFVPCYGHSENLSSSCLKDDCDYKRPARRVISVRFELLLSWRDFYGVSKPTVASTDAASHGQVVSFYRSMVTNYVLLHLHLFLSLTLRGGTNQSKRRVQRQCGHVGSFLLPLWSWVISTCWEAVFICDSFLFKISRSSFHVLYYQWCMQWLIISRASKSLPDVEYQTNLSVTMDHNSDQFHKCSK